MTSYLHIGAGLLVGTVLGTLFYGGLWWTVVRSMTLAQPAWLILGSFLLRTLVTVAGFYFILQGGWPSLTAALAAFLLTRMVITRRIGMPARKRHRCLQGGTL